MIYIAIRYHCDKTAMSLTFFLHRLYSIEIENLMSYIYA